MEAMPVKYAKQALILTLGNGLTRGLGFVLRLLLARRMGAQALGVMEMANSVGMLALTPVTAGIPSAVSRLTAKEGGNHILCDLKFCIRICLRKGCLARLKVCSHRHISRRSKISRAYRSVFRRAHIIRARNSRCTVIPPCRRHVKYKGLIGKSY